MRRYIAGGLAICLLSLIHSPLGDAGRAHQVRLPANEPQLQRITSVDQGLPGREQRLSSQTGFGLFLFLALRGLHGS
jgi:hypothetical protein